MRPSPSIHALPQALLQANKLTLPPCLTFGYAGSACTCSPHTGSHPQARRRSPARRHPRGTPARRHPRGAATPRGLTHRSAARRHPHQALQPYQVNRVMTAVF